MVVRTAARAPYLSALRVLKVLPCITDQRWVRLHAEPSRDLSEIMPYLNAVLPRAVYNPGAPALTLNREGRILTLYRRLVFLARAHDTADAHAALEWLMQAVNDTHARRAEITPIRTRRERLAALDLYKLLPGLNCGRCGVPTCLAFAVGVGAEEANVLGCAPLWEAEFQERRRALLELLRAGGYEVPSAFLHPTAVAAADLP